MKGKYPYYRVWGYKVYSYEEAVMLATQMAANEYPKSVEIWKKLDSHTPIYQLATITV